MKYCAYCGKEYPDDSTACAVDGQPLRRPGEDEVLPPTHAMPPPLISPEEQLFWERMTWRQFAILMLRIQALFLFFYAIIDATYLPTYFLRIPRYANAVPEFSSPERLALFFLIVRIIFYVAAGLVFILHAERILSWLVKDCVLASQSEDKKPDQK